MLLRKMGMSLIILGFLMVLITASAEAIPILITIGPSEGGMTQVVYPGDSWDIPELGTTYYIAGGWIWDLEFRTVSHDYVIDIQSVDGGGVGINGPAYPFFANVDDYESTGEPEWIQSAIAWGPPGITPGTSFYIKVSEVFGEEALHVHASPVPEPATMLLLGSGLAGLFGLGRKRMFKS